MAKQLKFELTTPERVVEDRPAESVTLPTQEGEITVLPGHIPLVATLKSGMITLRHGTEETFLAVSGGFVEIRPDGRVIILADTADRAEELDLEKVEEARERARLALEEKRGLDEVSSAAAFAALERELARERTVKRYRDLKKRPISQ
ncbi:ATP synthase F1 subunit epsilon [Candidatus Uhrbacteria bacterium RIFOXYC2_FULL_47_19]|uniref:ATP synthase epsilon chain n=1 Tax=Candidatus Uhrbacteria bacterium RIFOXYC2_FULL_47_19 TaxID=1802424 RepID=A0A1F7WC73_9BACT|nr:MAG: ATP synthase F1 subunit epsilon [Candidatus Uhrbacteria bacterium RIFOXYC2_FULL_47_19]HCC22193.1 ATP synthase F1 subunit epsilon [Candidatus Uhrbacteria bacterium]